MMGLSDYLKSWQTIEFILFMTTFNFQSSILLLPNVVRFKVSKIFKFIRK